MIIKMIKKIKTAQMIFRLSLVQSPPGETRAENTACYRRVLTFMTLNLRKRQRTKQRNRILVDLISKIQFFTFMTLFDNLF